MRSTEFRTPGTYRSGGYEVERVGREHDCHEPANPENKQEDFDGTEQRPIVEGSTGRVTESWVRDIPFTCAKIGPLQQRADQTANRADQSRAARAIRVPMLRARLVCPRLAVALSKHGLEIGRLREGDVRPLGAPRVGIVKGGRWGELVPALEHMFHFGRIG